MSCAVVFSITFYSGLGGDAVVAAGRIFISLLSCFSCSLVLLRLLSRYLSACVTETWLLFGRLWALYYFFTFEMLNKKSLSDTLHRFVSSSLGSNNNNTDDNIFSLVM